MNVTGHKAAAKELSLLAKLWFSRFESRGAVAKARFKFYESKRAWHSACIKRIRTKRGVLKNGIK